MAFDPNHFDSLENGLPMIQLEGQELTSQVQLIK